MPTWVLQLASLKLTIFLLVLFVLVLAAGTVVEARFGTQTAQAVYFAPWFLGLQILFGINLVCSLLERWPWGRQRIGFVLTHGSLLLILLGALTTAGFKEEGQLSLWEGEEKAEFVDSQIPGELIRYPLAFSLRLEAFEIDFYPGTRRPAQFRSRLRVNDLESGASFPAVIEMNRELAYGGYRFFQSSYRQEGGREMTVLSVSRDPGQPVVFAGYGLLVLGMLTVFSTRLDQRRRLRDAGPAPLPEPAESTAGPVKIVAGLLLGALLGTGVSAATGGAEVASADSEAIAALRSLPVQHDGRVMPLDTLAREAVWRVTGERTWGGLEPVELVLGWSFAPAAWSDRSVVRLAGPRLASELGLDRGARYASIRQLAESPRLVALMREAREQSQLGEPLPPLLTDARTLEDRLIWMQRFLTGKALAVVPSLQADGSWSSPDGVGSVTGLRALQTDLAANAPDHYPSPTAIRRELSYNRLRPTRMAWLLLAAATALSLVGWFRPRPWLDRLASVALIAGFAVMTWGIATRWLIAGRIPAANMYESMLFLGWGVGLFAVLASLAARNRLVVLNAAAMSFLSMVLLDLLPMDPFVHPMPPVLTGTPWLAIHVPITMVSYSVFAIAMLVAHVQIALQLFAPRRRDLVARLYDLLYWYMHIGSILLAAGILTGSVWAASSWGRYWGWDPKEVWSLIALLAYMAILHGRVDRVLGPFGTAAASIVAFWAVLMTYLGVNFILAAGLHSYGFGESRLTTWLVLLAAAEIVFLMAAILVHQQRLSSAATPTPAA